MARFSWLHFSDLDLGPSGSRLLDPRFREALERDLRKVHERTGPWDVVVLSGNLTHEGSSREFDVLGSSLNSLWDYFSSLGSNPVLVAVPGEQEFRRQESGASYVDHYSAANIREAFRQQSRNSLQLLTQGRFLNFSRWLAHATVPLPAAARKGLLPGDCAVTVEAEGLRVGIVCLNSVFRDDPKDPEKLREIHVEQIEEATGGGLRSWARQHDLLVLVTHTPPVMLKLSSLAVLREKLMPTGRPLLHLCGGHAEPGWRESHRPWVVQAPSLFGDAGRGYWGYTAGQISSAGLQLMPRHATSNRDFIGLGHDPAYGVLEDSPPLPLEALTPVMHLPLGEEATPLAAPQVEDAESFIAREVAPQSAGLPEEVRLQRVLEIGQRPVSALAWAPSGEVLCLGIRHGHLLYWKTGAPSPSWMIRAHPEAITEIAFSPDGKTVLSRADLYHAEQEVRAWDEQGAAVKVPPEVHWKLDVPETLLRAVPERVFDIAPMPGTALIAVASPGGLLIRDIQANRWVVQLEGHRDWVRGVSFSFDGRLLASIADDGRVLMFRTDVWEQVAEFHVSRSALAPWFLAFSPTRNVLATAASRFSSVRLWDIDVDALLKSRAASATVHEVSAKVVLVGEGRTGKSSLALRLVQDRYEEMDSTHGMRFWSLPEDRLGPVAGPSHQRRELILWDMGGQSEYQLVHQLFLGDSAAALMVMEPGRGEAAVDEIEGWNQRLLKQPGARELRKLLVGTKLDTAASAENLPALEALVKRCGFQGYVATSAKTGQGLEELKAALARTIDWDSLEKVSSPELYQRMRQQLQRLREERRVVLTFSALERELRRELGSEFDPQVLRSVVGPLSRQGLMADTRLADGTRVLVLEVEQVERYAGSLILAARDNAHGVPAIDVAKVLSPAMRFPRIPQEQRLHRDQELLVLDCVIELLLEHGVCLRHEGLLIFPSLFRPTEGMAEVDSPRASSLYYDFSGPIDNIYASLITSLALSRRFGAMRLGNDRAEFGRAGEDCSGVRRVNEGSKAARGQARLDVYFDTSTHQGTRELFINLIEEHLREHGVTLMERLSITCVCGQVFPEDTVRKRLAAGHPDIGCPDCDHRTPLTLGAQQARERDPALVKRLHALRTDIQENRSQNIAGAKVSMTEARALKPSQDTPLRILHLSDLHVGEGDDPVSLLQPLAAALRDGYEGLGLERLDYLVVSGDITSRASPAEFEQARELVSGIIEQFSLTAERCILVPGNHDLDWNTEAYRFENKRQVDTRRLKPGLFVELERGYLLREEAKYPERFKNFSQHFYHPLTQRAYPLAPEEQCLPLLFTESRLQFLAMNSAWEIDEYFPERSGICEQALSRGLSSADQALAQARKRGELPRDARVLRLAVLHHPITGNEKIQADAFLGRLQQADVRVCLHGHVHEDRAELVNYLHAQRRVHVVGAGSFGAPMPQRPESVPRLFNLLEVERDLSRIRVHTRAQRKQGGAWEGWAMWPGEKPGDRRAYYEFPVP